MTEIQREEAYEWLQDFLDGLSDFSKNNDDYLCNMYDDEAYFISYIIISKIFDIVKPDRIETYRNTLIEIKVFLYVSILSGFPKKKVKDQVFKAENILNVS